MTKTKWYAKPIYLLVALVLVAGLAGVPAAPVAATTFDVNDTMTTSAINTAIAGASDGDVIQFAGGAYELSATLTIDVSGVTLRGDVAAPSNVVIDADTNSVSPAIEITADDVTVEGFTINGSSSSTIVGATGDNFVVANCSVSGGYVAILIEGTDSIVILDNTISDFVKGGIVVKDTLSVQIEHNIISTTDHSEAPNGIQIGYVMDYTEPTGTVDDNQISGCHWSGYDPGTTDYEGGWTGSGILVIAPDSALMISGNEVQNSDVGLDIEAGSGTSIEGNDVHDNSYGFVLWNADPAINFNNISGNSLGGVYRAADGDLTGTVDAENNWWGHASGPSGEYGRVNKKNKVIGKGDSVSDNVNWDPWLPQPVGHTKHDLVPPGLR